MSHAYDFYKPNLASEYPVVDGKLSQICYLMALDSCYKSFCKKYEKLEGKQFSADDADYFVFHSPCNKLVQKSFALLVFSDYLSNASSVDEAAKEKLAPFSSLTDDESYTSRDLEKASQQVAEPLYDAKVQPATLVPKQVGNMYTASLYAAFVSLIHNKHNSLVPVNRLIKRSEQTPLKEKKLATRVKESENAGRGNGKKSPVVVKKWKEKECDGDNIGELDLRENEWKPLLEVNKKKCEIVEKGNVKEKLRKKRAEEAENIPISLDANNVNDKEGDILLQIRTCPPSPQCFSVGCAPSKATPLKASRSRPPEYKVLPMNYKAYVVLPVGVKENFQSMVGFVGAVFASVFPIYRLISV